ncbi:hnRNP-L/PTB/hephaestus splicing factor family protein, partial [Ostertagia ostertagi]
VIHQICEPHAKVLRIAIVRKSMMQALVEFESAENAKKVKHAINGADIYSGCCTLKVEFAKPEYVKVTRQDSDQWDFTLGEGGGMRPVPSGYHGDYGDCEPSPHYPPVGGTGCVLMIYGIDHEKLNCEKLFNLLCQYGNVLRIRFMATKKDTVMAELGTPTAVGNAIKYLQGITLFGLTLQLKPSIQAAVRDV